MESEKVEKFFKELKENRFEVISMSIATICLIIGLIVLFNPKNLEQTARKFEEGLKEGFSPLVNHIIELEKSYNRLSSKFDSLVMLKEDSLQHKYFNNIEYYHLKSKVQELNVSIEKMEKIILDNPEKALSMPLLKQQFEYQKEQSEKENNQLRNEIARVYDINKWIIGLVFGMLVSIIMLNISNLSKNKKE